jgi:hypothetical protein
MIFAKRTPLTYEESIMLKGVRTVFEPLRALSLLYASGPTTMVVLRHRFFGSGIPFSELTRAI